MNLQRIERKDLGSGAATGFSPDIVYIPISSLLNGECPEPDEDGLIINSTILFKPGKAASSFYVTAETLKINEDTVGETDSEGYETKAEATAPGDNLILKKLRKESLKENFLILYKTCKGGDFEMMGTCCNPIRLKFGVEKDKDKTVTKITMTRSLNTDEPTLIYRGGLSFVEPTVINSASFTPTQTQGYQYNLTPSVTGNLSLNLSGLNHGDVIALVGGGGTTPGTLASSSSVLLKDGAAWEALDGAKINLKVFDNGTTKVLVEVSRS